MVRIAWYSAKQLGAQPSGTDSFRRTAGREDGYTLAVALEEWLELLGILQNNSSNS